MTNIRGVGGNRLVWTDLPDHVRAGIEGLLGAPVIDASNEPGGFSPGLAARVALADGRRMFVKAVNSDRNEHSVQMFATEARILAGLRAVELRAPVAVPELLGTFEEDGWIALAITEVDGHQPAIPWRPAELDLVVRAVGVLGECLTPNPLPIVVPTIATSCVDIFAGWRGLAGGSIDARGVPDWAVANLDRLAELESGWSTAATGRHPAAPGPTCRQPAGGWRPGVRRRLATRVHRRGMGGPVGDAPERHHAGRRSGRLLAALPRCPRCRRRSDERGTGGVGGLFHDICTVAPTAGLTSRAGIPARTGRRGADLATRETWLISLRRAGSIMRQLGRLS